jgi:hypothetical protein
LVQSGLLAPEEAQEAHVRNVLHRYLGCAEGNSPAECRSFRPHGDDHLVLATDGVWGLLEEDDLLDACWRHPEPQACADDLVERALARGSRDNVTCVVAAFEPVHIDPEWLAWNDGTVARLARAICADKDFERMPVLADALEEAGCTNRAVLDHCRGPGRHAPGCWAVDLLLGNVVRS